VIVLGLIAMNMANSDARGFDTGRLDPSGEGMTNAGRICGIIGMSLGILAIAANVVRLVLIFSR
jgi:hypothetical protein